jgi:hypothetical protein
MSLGGILMSVGAALHIATQTAWSLSIVLLDVVGGTIFAVGACFALDKMNRMLMELNPRPKKVSKVTTFWKNLKNWKLQGYIPN